MGHPVSLFHEDGFMCKNAKSELVVMLESTTSLLKDITIDPINTVIINDGMAFMQYMTYMSAIKKKSTIWPSSICQCSDETIYCCRHHYRAV